MENAIHQRDPHRFDIPGPVPAPVFGRMLNTLRFFGDPIGYAQQLFDRYGSITTLSRYGGTQTRTPLPDCQGTLLVRGAEALSQIMTDAETFHMFSPAGPLYPLGDVPHYKQSMQRMATGLFHANGEYHRQSKQLIAPAVHHKHIEVYHDLMVAAADEMLRRWRVGESRDIYSEMVDLSGQIITRALFGESADQHPRILPVINLIRQFMLSPLTAPALLIDTLYSPYRCFLRFFEQAEQEIALILQDRLNRSAGAEDMLSIMAQKYLEHGRPMSEAEMISHAFTLIMAGYETVASTMTWILFLLSQHPDVMTKLMAELDAVVGSAAPTAAHLEKLTYLECIIKEGMRLFPAVPIGSRITIRDSEIGSQFVPQGTEIWLCFYHTQRDPALYPHPNRFDPDRWLTIKPSVFEYSPFGAGARRCIGAPFAMMEMKIVLSILLQRYRLEFADDQKLNRLVWLIMSPRGGLTMTVRSQDRNFVRSAGWARGNIHQMVDLPQ